MRFQRSASCNALLLVLCMVTFWGTMIGEGPKGQPPISRLPLVSDRGGPGPAGPHPCMTSKCGQRENGQSWSKCRLQFHTVRGWQESGSQEISFHRAGELLCNAWGFKKQTCCLVCLPSLRRHVLPFLSWCPELLWVRRNP